MARSTATIQADIELTRDAISAQLNALRARMPGLAWANYTLASGALATGFALSRLPLLRVTRLVRTGAQFLRAGAKICLMLAAIRQLAGNGHGRAQLLETSPDDASPEPLGGPSGTDARRDPGSPTRSVADEIERSIADGSDRPPVVARAAVGDVGDIRGEPGATGARLRTWPSRLRMTIRAHPLLSAVILISIGYALGKVAGRG